MKHTLTLLLLFIASYTYSCSVAFYSFCESVDTHHVVLRCVMIDSVLHGRRFEVLDVIKGTENRDTITVWNGVDFDCNGLWSLSAEYMCNIGDTILAALTPSGIDYVRTYNFGYTPELRYSNDTLFGLISGYAFGPPELDVWQLAYTDFINYWNAHAQSCEQLVGINETKKDALYLYPNPVTDEVFFNTTFSYVRYVLYNSLGQEIKGGVVSGASINLNDVVSGVYFLQLQDKALTKLFRLQKQ